MNHKMLRLFINAALPAEAGALVMKALNAAMKDDVSAETSESTPTFPMRRADALAVIAESFLQHGHATLSGGDRHQIVIHVDAATLRHDQPGCCEIEHGPAVSAETARRLACDASFVPLVENEKGEPLNVGRKTRNISAALRRVLNARDRGCRFPGCSNTRYVDAHHIHHWAHGGETKPSNLISLCRFHHRKVHEGGVRIELLDDGAFRFLKGNGQVIGGDALDRERAVGNWDQLVAQHNEMGVYINEQTAATRWRGEIMDYGLAVEGLLAKYRRADVSAEMLRSQG